MSELSAELAREVSEQPAWMFPWQLAPDVGVPLVGENLPPVHQTRLELLERRVSEALAAAGPGATALDLACCEGWFAHRLLEWGAARVVGVDIRELNVRRAKLVRDHFGIPPERLAFRQGDVFELDPDELGRFDVVLMLGLVYHLENPVGALRRARVLTRGVCAVESQLTRQDRPLVHGNGSGEMLLTAAASFAATVEADAEHNQLASTPGILSLIPNHAALEAMMRVAGFEHVDSVEPAPHHERQYVRGDRAVVVGR